MSRGRFTNDQPAAVARARDTLRRTVEELRILDSVNGIRAWEWIYGCKYPGPGYRRVLEIQRDRLREELSDVGTDG